MVLILHVSSLTNPGLNLLIKFYEFVRSLRDYGQAKV